jgi:hypothetical protein
VLRSHHLCETTNAPPPHTYLPGEKPPIDTDSGEQGIVAEPSAADTPTPQGLSRYHHPALQPTITRVKYRTGR